MSFKAAIKSPTSKLTFLYVHTSMILPTESGFETAIFFDTSKEDLALCHDDGLGNANSRY